MMEEDSVDIDTARKIARIKGEIYNRMVIKFQQNIPLQ